METDSAVLVVDDEAIFRRELAASLNARSLRAFTAGTHEEALAELNGKPEIKVVLLDLRIPDIDGIDIAANVQRLRPDVAIVFVSGHDSEEYRARSVERGLRVEAWINKGADSEDLVKRIGAAVCRIIDRQALARCRAVLETVHGQYPFSPEQKTLLEAGLSSVFERPVAESLVGESSNRSGSLNIRARVTNSSEVMDEMALCLDELLVGHGDPARRELAWYSLNQLVNTSLWPLIDKSGLTREARQIAIQLKLGVRRIAAPQLTIDHINALYLCLERMRSESVGPSDVSACKRRFREAGIETLPSFHKVLLDWERFYRDETGEDAEETGSARNDDTDAPPGR